MNDLLLRLIQFIDNQFIIPVFHTLIIYTQSLKDSQGGKKN